MEYKEIRPKQLTLFDEPEPLGGDVITCSFEHPKPRRAKYKVYFRNGYFRYVCGLCVKKFKPEDNPNIERIEPYKQKRIKKNNQYGTDK